MVYIYYKVSHAVDITEIIYKPLSVYVSNIHAMVLCYNIRKSIITDGFFINLLNHFVRVLVSWRLSRIAENCERPQRDVLLGSS